MGELASSEVLRAELRARGFERAKEFSFDSELALLAEVFVKIKPSWAKRLRRRLSLWWTQGRVWSRAKVTNVYRYCRGLLRTALSR
jgi:hypothetical protein